MYPKPVADAQGAKIGPFGVGGKHVVMEANDVMYAMGKLKINLN